MTILLALAATLSALCGGARAQCAMCKQSLESSSDAAAFASGLNLAVLVLLVPAVVMFAGIFGVFYRYRNPSDRS